ncbi:MarC family membrane protein [Oxalobacteraceae bacterium GrIS 2.11]
MNHSFFQSFVLLILVTDPFGGVPLFVSALSSVAPERRWKVVVRECIIAFLILLIFIFFGQHFLDALQLSEISLRIGGGVILFLIALRMVFPQPGGIFGDVDHSHEPFIVPLAIPALAGPSALATVLLFSSDSGEQLASDILALVMVAFVWLIVLLSAERMQRILGERTMMAFERLMGLILTAMSVEMVLAGLHDYLKTL